MIGRRWQFVVAYKAVVTCLAVCLLGTACQKREPPEEVVAKVNDDVIGKTAFQEQVERNMARYRGQAQSLPPGIEARIKESVLRRMIDDMIVAQKAKALKVTLTNEEVDAKYKEHKERFRSEQAFEDYLKRSNNTEAYLKDDLRHALLRDRLVEAQSGNITVADADVQKYYQDNLARFREPEQIKARRLVISVKPDATAADKKAKLKLAQKYLAAAKKPKADFAKLCHDHSEGPEAGHDGDMGGFFARGHMSPEFDQVAFALKPNDLSDVIETRLGYEVVQVTEKKAERVKPFDEVKEGLQASLLARARNDKRREVLSNLKSEAKIEILVQFDQPPAAGSDAGQPPPPGGTAQVTPPGGAPPPPPPPGTSAGAPPAPPPPQAPSAGAPPAAPPH